MLELHNVWGHVMKTGFAVLFLSVAAGFSGNTASGQSLSKVGPPAEFPPSSYSGRQYVDSRGCVYVRAGFDGNVTWVPRVTRDRKALCGYQPTALTTTAADEAPVVADVPETPAPPQDPVVATTPATTRPVQSEPQQPARVVRSTPQPAQQQQRVRVVRAAPVTTAAPSQQTGRIVASASTAAVCPGVTGISSQYVGGNRGGYAVRCGSQQVNPYGESGVIRGGSAGIYRAAPQVRHRQRRARDQGTQGLPRRLGG